MENERRRNETLQEFFDELEALINACDTDLVDSRMKSEPLKRLRDTKKDRNIFGFRDTVRFLKYIVSDIKAYMEVDAMPCVYGPPSVFSILFRR